MNKRFICFMSDASHLLKLYITAFLIRIPTRARERCDITWMHTVNTIVLELGNSSQNLYVHTMSSFASMKINLAEEAMSSTVAYATGCTTHTVAASETVAFIRHIDKL